MMTTSTTAPLAIPTMTLTESCELPAISLFTGVILLSLPPDCAVVVSAPVVVSTTVVVSAAVVVGQVVDEHRRDSTLPLVILHPSHQMMPGVQSKMSDFGCTCYHLLHQDLEPDSWFMEPNHWSPKPCIFPMLSVASAIDWAWLCVAAAFTDSYIENDMQLSALLPMLPPLPARLRVPEPQDVE